MEHGPRAVVAKQGEYGAALFTEDSFFALPGFPLEDVRDPTGAGDSFAGGFLGYIDSHDGDLDEACLRRAMGYGTVLASFNVEQFGTERVAALTREEIDERFAELHAMTRFEPLRRRPNSARRSPQRNSPDRPNCDTWRSSSNILRRGDGHRAADQKRSR